MLLQFCNKPDQKPENKQQASNPVASPKRFGADAGYFEAVERNEVDALIYDSPFATTEIKKHAKTTKIVQFNLNSLTYAIGVLWKNNQMLVAINDALHKIMDSDCIDNDDCDYRKLARKYLSYESKDVKKPAK
ncbi:MAG: transporter substrate-binding domain-containing protein [Candidatus Magnetobacterium sp. LHC-1]|uniref:Transporter substrate-binding domain-containing protein n=1 Tax=Candidatus Magnetobacterium casense TaxID=1455061 RepID=A0ABS6RW75_9BACT|nr:transporter substrate-binding domain-containing protein [Candidatus Magnetobacterium casensis]MBF0607908.1 transporter substrate-binding domain-containing protein [Nitrospirota bacterium]MBV6340880.1 transporter substrate-binding domain-containing protein [Candidatus Magnetobacterium casensis]